MPPENHMTGETSQRVNELAMHLHRNVSIDNMTKKKKKKKENGFYKLAPLQESYFFMPSQRSTNHIRSEDQLSYDPYGPASAFFAKPLMKVPCEDRTHLRERGRKKPYGPTTKAYSLMCIMCGYQVEQLNDPPY